MVVIVVIGQGVFPEVEVDDLTLLASSSANFFNFLCFDAPGHRLLIFSIPRSNLIKFFSRRSYLSLPESSWIVAIQKDLGHPHLNHWQKANNGHLFCSPYFAPIDPSQISYIPIENSYLKIYFRRLLWVKWKDTDNLLTVTLTLNVQSSILACMGTFMVYFKT